MSVLVAAVEALYEGVVTDPGAWNEQAFVDWADSVASEGPVSKLEAKYVRRAMRSAQALQRFWAAAGDRDDIGWESRVDLALGPRAWRPVLDLAQLSLEEHPDEEAFDETVRLFRVVNNAEFLDGMDYDTWRDLSS